MSQPKIVIVPETKDTKVPWKNGLGDTGFISSLPAGKNQVSDSFIWRLVENKAINDCSFSVRPGFDVVLLQLPNADNTDNSMVDQFNSLPLLHHNDQETPVKWKPLVPYTYNGEWPTTCRITQHLKYIAFHYNRQKAQVQVALETICHQGATDDGICDGDGDNTSSKTAIPQPTSKILLGNYTIVYVVSGALNVQIDQDGSTNRVLTQGETLILERNDESEPTDFAMTPAQSSQDLYETLEKKKSVTTAVPNNARLELYQDDPVQDATVFIIQVNLKTERQASSTWDLPGISPPPVRRGSVIIYDDQPFWPLSDEPSFNASSADLTGAAPSPQSTAKEGCTHPNLSTKYWESARHYRPPVFSARYVNESEVPPPIVRDTLVIEEFPIGKISTAWINMVKQGLSEWIKVPVIIARGFEEGPVVGITAVVHGNELNGVPCIHRVITDIDVNRLKGTVVAVPCVNVPGYLRFSREFSDGKDLNRLFPGQENGTASQMYAYNLLTKIIERFNILIDLHTASFGRVNSYYVRSDMNDPGSAILAKLQQPQIILHNSGQDGTLRSAASSRGIKAITVEIGNPQLFQNQYVQWSYMGVMSILSYLGMFSLDPSLSMTPGATPGDDYTKHLPRVTPSPSTVFCSKGFWIYTRTGGVLEVYPGVNTVVRKGALIARIKNIFGNIVDEIFSPVTGITIGRSSNPVAMAGDRVLHLGIIKKENEILPTVAKENY